MTDTKPADKPGQLKETERITQGPGPGRGPMGGGMVGQKASDVRPVGQAAGRASWRRERSKAIAGPAARGRQRRADVDRAADPGPGHRPDLRRRPRPATSPPGVTQEQAVEALRAQGRRQAGRPDRQHEGPRARRRASTSPPSATCCCSCWRCTSSASLLAWLQGYLLNDVVQGTVRRMRADVEDKVNALPLSYFDKQPRGELLSRVTNDIDNISQSLQQTMSQLLTSLLTVRRSWWS